LRRFIIIGTAVAALSVAAVAYAATLNNYTAKVSFTSSKAGSPAKPVPMGFTETLGASNATAGKVAAPLVDIKTTVYGLVSNLKPFKTCSMTTILAAPKFNAACPKGSEVATGSVQAELGGPTLDQTKASACDPGLTVYNAGGGKEWYFFTAVGTQCGTLHTGSTPPYPGTVKQSGKNLVLDVPLPPFVSTEVAHVPNLYGSLIHEVVNIKPLTAKVKGKTVYSQASVACKGGQRPWSIEFTAVATATSPKVSKTVSGSSKC
jgi:hypothetical protein